MVHYLKLETFNGVFSVGITRITRTCTDNHKIRYEDNLTVMKASVKR